MFLSRTDHALLSPVGLRFHLTRGLLVLLEDVGPEVTVLLLFELRWLFEEGGLAAHAEGSIGL